LWYLPFHRHSLLTPALSEKQLWHLHTKYGASFRNLLTYADTLGTYKKTLDLEISKLGVEQLHILITSADNSPNTFDYLISTSPIGLIIFKGKNTQRMALTRE